MPFEGYTSKCLGRPLPVRSQPPSHRLGRQHRQPVALQAAGPSQPQEQPGQAASHPQIQPPQQPGTAHPDGEQQTQAQPPQQQKFRPQRYAAAGGRRPPARMRVSSDGYEHLGSALKYPANRPFPGPPPGQGPPLRILPIGGLGEIGMNCMLVGVYDRYILIDAGLMFPDFTDLGVQKILPDTSFLAQWRDKIEAVFITHGHEDHIGALPWVIPALDPATPVFAAGFSMQLVKRRLQEFNLWDESRFHVFQMNQRFQLGPFECEPIRVTHSIPDCCGLILRSEHGNIVHTGDWKIDEDPIDNQIFDRTAFEAIGREGVSLLMSDSTNVLSPGRTKGEAGVKQALIERVQRHNGKGRVVVTQFASNLHRIAGVKAAADAANRKICFIGMSLNTYLEAAERDGRAPFSSKDLIHQADLDRYDPSEVLIVTTGSQAEPRAALSLASREASHVLKLNDSDLLLYAARVIPGNETRVQQMMNNIARLGPEIVSGHNSGLHTSGHAYQGELEEVMKLVKPKQFLPVHGEYAFLKAHAALARDVGIHNTSVIQNGQMLGVFDRRNANTVSSGSLNILGQAQLQSFYNDGNKGTGSAEEMALDERNVLAVEGVVVAAVDVIRNAPTAGGAVAGAAFSPRRLRARVRITTRALWVDEGRLLEDLHKVCEAAVAQLPPDVLLVAVERTVAEAIRRCCKAYNKRRPEVVVIAHEWDPRAGAAAAAQAIRQADAAGATAAARQQSGPGPSNRVAPRGGGGGRRWAGPATQRRPRPATGLQGAWRCHPAATRGLSRGGTARNQPGAWLCRGVLPGNLTGVQTSGVRPEHCRLHSAPSTTLLCDQCLDNHLGAWRRLQKTLTKDTLLTHPSPIKGAAARTLLGFKAGTYYPFGQRPVADGQVSANSLGNGIDYHDGPVILGDVFVYLIWYGSWTDPSAKRIITNMVSNIGAAPYWTVNKSYYSSSVASDKSFVGSAVFLAGEADDLYSSSKTGVYMVLTDDTVSITSGFCSSYCGWHASASMLGTDIRFGLVGNPQKCPDACAYTNKATPNGNWPVDSMASIVAHELEEAVTDPDFTSWYDSAGMENADKCAWRYGTTYTTGNGATANMRLGSMDYLIQQNWVNSKGGYCASSWTGAASS
ncbi:hypothetical protein WJX72_001027 [[Myrmecia] bisecta]|uniref:Metallo-beta-lactamase domain-containing protein n=1 Tax=[Myrmecia] bisecta TaxID=41462 RepID=A0AAW1R4U3_9CHLO